MYVYDRCCKKLYLCPSSSGSCTVVAPCHYTVHHSSRDYQLTKFVHMRWCDLNSTLNQVMRVHETQYRTTQSTFMFLEMQKKLIQQ